jgi:hypothetical protein
LIFLVMVQLFKQIKDSCQIVVSYAVKPNILLINSTARRTGE